jgi:hypothetical protein
MENILIIESPGLEDITTVDRTGYLLSEQLKLLRVPHVYFAVHTSSLLQGRLAEYANIAGVIHIAAHGNEIGTYFTDNSGFTWNELQQNLLVYAGDRLIVLSACHSAFFNIDKTLAELLESLTAGVAKPPKCVLTMWGVVNFPDAVLAWGLFYRTLFKSLADRTLGSFTPRMILESLKPITRGLPVFIFLINTLFLSKSILSRFS